MLESIWISLPVSVILGLLSGLGTGGGSLLILWLTVVLGMDPRTARVINLLFFLPAALVSTLLRWKQSVLDLKAILPAILAGCAGAVAGAWIGTILDLAILEKLFGGLLIFTGIRELLYKPKHKSGQP